MRGAQGDLLIDNTSVSFQCCKGTIGYLTISFLRLEIPLFARVWISGCPATDIRFKKYNLKSHRISILLRRTLSRQESFRRKKKCQFWIECGALWRPPSYTFKFIVWQFFGGRDVLRDALRKDQASSNAWPWNDQPKMPCRECGSFPVLLHPQTSIF